MGGALLAAAALAGGCTFDSTGEAVAVVDASIIDLANPGRHDGKPPPPDQGSTADLPIKLPPDGGEDTLPQDDVPGICLEGAYKCAGPGKEESHRCVGQNVYQLYKKCSMGCNLATGHCYTFQASNSAGSFFNKAKGQWVVKAKVTVNTSGGKFDPPQKASEVVMYCNQSCAIVVERLVVEKGGVIEAQGKRPLIIVANDEIKVKGTIDISAKGTAPGAGGHAGGKGDLKGEGCGGGAAGSGSSWDPMGGGAGGTFGGVGGKGNAKAPASCGHPCLAPLQGGSGGGDGESYEGEGGAGGGGLQLTAGNAIRIEGIIHAGGGGGRRGKADTQSWTAAGGGGGGSGGGILLEAPQLEVTGTVAANGGGGGGGASGTKSGGHGHDGSASVQPAKGGPPSYIYVAGVGGDGSGQTTVNGKDAIKGSLSFGGGGGGGGRICIRTRSGVHSGKGVITPFQPITTVFAKLTPK